jgi:cytoskeletal protein CcmA (bactofilin family)
LGTTDNVVFGNISGSNLTIDGNAFIDGTLTARTYVVSSSIVDIQSIKASGSTQFGDTIDDTHQFTGSVFLSGSLSSQGTITAPLFSGTFSGVISSSQQIQDLGFVTDGELSGSVYWDNILSKPSGIVSSSTQTLSHLFGTNIVSGSGQRSVLGLGENDSPRFSTLYATNANFDGNLLVGGTITARTYVVSSSVVNYQTILVSGSSKFGDTLDDTHQFTGSVVVTGSATINGDTTLSGDLLVFTGSAYMSGSLNVEGRFVLPSINQLPALDSTGSLVISGSNLYLFI